MADPVLIPGQAEFEPPDNTVTFNGDPVTFEGQPVVFTPSE